VRNLIQKHLIPILTVVSLLLMIGSMLLKPDNHIESPLLSNLSNFLMIIATAMLSGGIFAAVLKSLQFNKVFQEALEDIVYSKKFLSTNSDKKKKWDSVSHAMAESNVEKTLCERILSTIFNNYFPYGADYYYTKLNQNIKITWYNKKEKIVNIEVFTTMTINGSKNSPIELQWSNSNYSNETSYSTELYEVIKEKGEQSKSVKVNSTKEDITKQPVAANRVLTKATTTFELKGKNVYKVERKSTFNQCLLVDRYFGFTATRTITDGMTVIVNYPSDLNVQFLSCGTFDVFNHQFGSDKGSLSLTTDQVILQKQGFVLVFV